MSMKKSDLARHLESKLDGRMKGAGVPGRFAGGAALLPDRKSQRKIDSAAGLVPFACKLPADLAAALRERSAGYDGGVNALMADLVRRSLAA